MKIKTVILAVMLVLTLFLAVSCSDTSTVEEFSGDDTVVVPEPDQIVDEELAQEDDFVDIGEMV